MINFYDHYRNEMDMLQGNINRICVTSDISEIERMYEWAKIRLENIYMYRKSYLSAKHASGIAADTPQRSEE